VTLTSIEPQRSGVAANVPGPVRGTRVTEACARLAAQKIT
jgi:hypothetical protein